MIHTSQQYNAMSSQQQQAFVAVLLDLVTDGDKGAAYQKARGAGMQVSAENLLQELQALIKKPEAPTGSDNLAATTAVPRLSDLSLGNLQMSKSSEALPTPAKNAQPIMYSLFDVIEDRYGSDIRKKLEGLNATRDGQDICFPYEARSKDVSLIGAVLLKETEGRLTLYDLSITKKTRPSRSAESTGHHENFAIAITFIDDANSHGAITYSPLLTSLDPRYYDSAKSNGFKSRLDGSSWTDLTGAYSFAGNALMARLLNSSQATIVVEELSALAEKMEAHEKRELRRGALRDPSGFGQSGAAETASPLPNSYPLAGLTGKTIEPALQAISPLLAEDLKLLISSGDFQRAMQLADDLTSRSQYKTLGGDFRVVRREVHSVTHGLSGRSRKGN